MKEKLKILPSSGGPFLLFTWHGYYIKVATHSKATYNTYLSGVYAFRLKERVTHVRIHGRGKKFDVGGGRLFDSIEDLIEYYKKCLLMDDRGTAIYLYQVHECVDNVCVWGGGYKTNVDLGKFEQAQH